MQVATAIKILEKEAEFLGMGFLETLEFIQANPLTQPQKNLEAFRVIKYASHRMFA